MKAFRTGVFAADSCRLLPCLRISLDALSQAAVYARNCGQIVAGFLNAVAGAGIRQAGNVGEDGDGKFREQVGGKSEAGGELVRGGRRHASTVSLASRVASRAVDAEAARSVASLAAD